MQVFDIYAFSRKKRQLLKKELVLVCALINNYLYQLLTIFYLMNEAEMSENLSFFKKNSFGHSGSFGKKRNQLKAGQYLGRLIEVKPGQGKAFKSDEVRDTLAFFFELIDSGEVVTRTVGASNHIQSKCISLVNEMAPPSFDVLKAPEKLTAHILSLVGQTFLLQIEPSKCGKYNNIERVAPDCKVGA